MNDHQKRPRRNRKSPAMRALLAENHLRVSDLVQPVFVHDKVGRVAIPTLPGIYRHDIPSLLDYLQACVSEGIVAVAVFPVLDASVKTPMATVALEASNITCEAIRQIKQRYPDLIVISDIALDPYSSDGHDGIVKDGEILNDETVVILAKMAVLHAAAGVDIVAPSDMMDGRVGAIRKALDGAGYTQVSILSYAVKYASCLYGPFRDACDSAPGLGDKKTYQMDIANGREAFLEAALDIDESADMLMVKPGTLYLDVLARLKDRFGYPMAVYHVSGEYAMVKFAAQHGALDEMAVFYESMIAFKRAGADIILTYAALDIARFLNKGA